MAGIRNSGRRRGVSSANDLGKLLVGLPLFHVGFGSEICLTMLALFLAVLADHVHVIMAFVFPYALSGLFNPSACGWATELFGDYNPGTRLIRVWMRTAVRKRVTSFETFLSTLCHEFCHHLDFQRFRYGDSWHTRGFHERTAALYHLARGTPAKRLVWVKISGGRWRIDWARTNRTS